MTLSEGHVSTLTVWDCCFDPGWSKSFTTQFTKNIGGHGLLSWVRSPFHQSPPGHYKGSGHHAGG